jgi:hypothetical protein
MALLIGTIITHPGGSGTKEGSSTKWEAQLQISLLNYLHLTPTENNYYTRYKCGFASVFGTPLAGALFAL